MEPTIVFGPAGCGKSSKATQLQENFGCSEVVDEWDGVSPLPAGALALTNVAPPYAQPGRVIPFEQCGEAA